MVVVSKKTWFSDMRLRLGYKHNTGCGDSQTTLGILAFETARTMSRLVSLHRSLSDSEVTRLRDDAMRSIGVAYLNSPDQCFLFRLACAEMVDDLDRAAAAISRLCRRCRGVWPRGFDHVYVDLKAGAAEIGHLELGLQPKEVAKRVKRMEMYVAATSALHSEMETLAEMEVSELKLQRWDNTSGLFPAPGKPNTDLFRKKLALQRRRVRRLREESLWSQSFDRVAEIMAAAAISAFARICTVFVPYVSDLPSVVSDQNGRVGLAPHRHLQSYHHHRAGSYSSGPLERTVAENVIIRNSGPILRTPARTAPKPWKKEALEAPPSTLGASGLALRYANVIALAEKMALSPESRGEGLREELYHMLPVGLRAAVSAKLRNCWKMDSGRLDDGGLLASGWREAVGRILGWLAPMAHDMMQWQLDRSYERHRLDTGPRVLLLQTLWFSDKEKAEAAIVEVLVGLSYICRYQQSGEEEDVQL